jgi:hypothetical protein
MLRRRWVRRRPTQAVGGVPGQADPSGVSCAPTLLLSARGTEFGTTHGTGFGTGFGTGLGTGFGTGLGTGFGAAFRRNDVLPGRDAPGGGDAPRGQRSLALSHSCARETAASRPGDRSARSLYHWRS